jgi:hypothetical protein
MTEQHSNTAQLATNAFQIYNALTSHLPLSPIVRFFLIECPASFAIGRR